MTSERMQRRVERLLDQADEAAEAHDWTRVLDAARAVLAAEAENADGKIFLEMAMANLGDDALDESRTYIYLNDAGTSSDAPTVPVEGEDEYYLVVPVGSNRREGLSGHYER